MRLRDANEPVADVVARAADRDHLRILAVWIVELRIARDDLALERGSVDARLIGDRVHAAHELRERLRDDEVGAVRLECFNRRRRAGQRACEHAEECSCP